MRKGYIYVIVNKVNGKYYYGKTFDVQKRWRHHLNNSNKKINRRLYDAINHYGACNFSIHIIKEIFEVKNKINEILNEWEKYFINFSFSLDPIYGYNMTDGGDGGDTLFNHPNKKEIIEKQRKANIGKKRTPEQCKNIQKSLQDVYSKINPLKLKERAQKTVETRQQRVSIQGYTEKELNAQNINKHRLTKYNKSEEGRTRVSLQFKGKKKQPFSEQHRANIGKSSKGRKIPGKKISISGIIYESLHEASRQLNIPLMTIKNRLLSKNEKFNTWQYL